MARAESQAALTPISHCYLAAVSEESPRAESCSVCGRTILAGESTRGYLTRDGERREVCELCRVRSEGAGWIPAEAGHPLPSLESDGRRRGRVRRLFERTRQAATAVAPSPQEAAVEEGTDAAGAEAAPVDGEGPAPQRFDRQGRAGRRGRAVSAGGQRSRPRSVPQSPDGRRRRALKAFNASEHRRTVAGLIRSLGPPSVCAATGARAPAEVRVTVAWELSWYQWEVDLAAGGHPVRELARGDDPEELDEDDRRWNAHAGEDGELRLGAERDPARA